MFILIKTMNFLGGVNKIFIQLPYGQGITVKIIHVRILSKHNNCEN